MASASDEILDIYIRSMKDQNWKAGSPTAKDKFQILLGAPERLRNYSVGNKCHIAIDLAMGDTGI